MAKKKTKKPVKDVTGKDITSDEELKDEALKKVSGGVMREPIKDLAASCGCRCSGRMPKANASGFNSSYG